MSTIVCVRVCVCVRVRASACVGGVRLRHTDCGRSHDDVCARVCVCVCVTTRARACVLCVCMSLHHDN